MFTSVVDLGSWHAVLFTTFNLLTIHKQGEWGRWFEPPHDHLHVHDVVYSFIMPYTIIIPRHFRNLWRLQDLYNCGYGPGPNIRE